MTVPVKLAGFVVLLACVFALGAGLGALVGPFGNPDPPAHVVHTP